MKSPKLLTSILRPSALTRAISCVKASEFQVVAPENIKITTLLPDSLDHFETFKKIITNENIVFTSSWIDKWFGIKSLRQKCERTEIKLKLIEEGDTELSMPQEVMLAYKRGFSPAQITLNRFFSLEENKERLRDVYTQMTSRAHETGLGYYKFENSSNILLGGGALAPISDSNSVEKVDIALHILTPKKGIGSFCLDKMLTKAFEEHSVKEVWGSSIINHPGTPTLCAKHGMIIQNFEGMKYYYINDRMWEASKGKGENLRNNPIAASNFYNKNKNLDNNNEKGGR